MDIQKIKELYNQNQDLTEYFKTTQNKNNLNSQEIELIYDLQSGNYINGYENNKLHRKYKNKFTDEIVNHINNLNFKFTSILEAGIGEGTTFVNVIEKLNIPKLKSFGLDISWSRLAYANKFLKKHSIKNTKLVTGLLENLPFLENSIDIVYTSHSIEPNGGKEKEILKELFRVTKNYLILLEPSYEFGNNEQKERMNRLSYAKNLVKHCNELGYKIIIHKLLENHSADNNKTEIIIIEKSTEKIKSKDFLACPKTKTKLFKNKNFYYSAESFYSYPILENIACLNSENKILSTKLENFIKLDKTHPKYNKIIFLKSLEELMDEKIKNMYCPNCIGFLAIEENLEDEYFVEYINQIIKDFSSCTFKALVFNKNLNFKISNFFGKKNLQIIQILNIYEIFENIEIYLSNYERTYSNVYENGIVQFIRNYSNNVTCFGLGLNRKNITIKQHELNNKNYYQKFFDNIEYLGFEYGDITKYGKTYHEIFFKKAFEKYGVNIEFNINETVSIVYVYWNLKLILSNHEFSKYYLEFTRKFAGL